MRPNQIVDVTQSAGLVAQQRGAALGHVRNIVATLPGGFMQNRIPPTQSYFGPTGMSSRFITLGLISTGGEGSVYAVTDAASKPLATRALKVYHADRFGKEADQQRLLHILHDQATRLSKIDHPAILAPDAPFVDSKTGAVCVAMPLVRGKQLSALVADRNVIWDLDEGDVGCLILDQLVGLQSVADGLDLLHRNGLQHCDIKPDNMVVKRADGRGRPGDRHYIVLLDYGLLRFGDADAYTRTIAGTPHYQPPETLAGRGFSSTSDLYMFAATIAYVLTGEPPPLLVEKDWVQEKLSSSKSLPIASSYFSAVPELLISSLSQNPSDRPDCTMRELLDDVATSLYSHAILMGFKRRVEIEPSLSRRQEIFEAGVEGFVNFGLLAMFYSFYANVAEGRGWPLSYSHVWELVTQLVS